MLLCFCLLMMNSMLLTLHTTEIWLAHDTDSGGMKDRTHGWANQAVDDIIFCHSHLRLLGSLSGNQKNIKVRMEQIVKTLTSKLNTQQKTGRRWMCLYTFTCVCVCSWVYRVCQPLPCTRQDLLQLCQVPPATSCPRWLPRPRQAPRGQIPHQLPPPRATTTASLPSPSPPSSPPTPPPTPTSPPNFPQKHPYIELLYCTYMKVCKKKNTSEV